MIDLRDALNLLQTGCWCKVAYVSADNKKDRYGKIIRIARCRLYMSENDQLQAKADQADDSFFVELDKKHGIKRNPNHFRNNTRNLRLHNSQIRKMHIRLLFAINDKKIL